MDLELKAFFEDMFSETEDDRLARLNPDCEPFAFSDATGYAGDVVEEVNLAESLEALLGVDSIGASSIASEIVKARQADTTRVSKRRAELARIVERTRRLPALKSIYDHPSWNDLLESAECYVNKCVQEACR